MVELHRGDQDEVRLAAEGRRDPLDDGAAQPRRPGVRRPASGDERMVFRGLAALEFGEGIRPVIGAAEQREQGLQRLAAGERASARRRALASVAR